ncbi:MAG: thioredoxin domain-containing protein [Putridiphycobacter sp.]|nr:thioredoxin domain-containing protein [Putridiphycobacter sp.]
MKKNITIILTLALVAFFGFAFRSEKSVSTEETPGIVFFKGTWEEAIVKAKKEKKLIFVDAYASWCGPCKILAKKYFVKENVGDFYNSKFINYKMDMEKDANGPRLARAWGLTAYPTLYFVNTKESVIHTSVGLINDKALIKIAEEALAK